jgi:hypothetical protein
VRIKPQTAVVSEQGFNLIEFVLIVELAYF